MKDLAEVCPLSRGVMSPYGSTPIRSITERPSLSPHSSTRTAMGSPCGSLPPKKKGGRYGLTLFHLSNTSGLDPAYPPVAFMSV